MSMTRLFHKKMCIKNTIYDKARKTKCGHLCIKTPQLLAKTLASNLSFLGGSKTLKGANGKTYFTLFAYENMFITIWFISFLKRYWHKFWTSFKSKRQYKYVKIMAFLARPVYFNVFYFNLLKFNLETSHFYIKLLYTLNY